MVRSLSLQSFDFNLHFLKFQNNRFFDELTYANLLRDVALFSNNIGFSNEESFGLKIKSPYFFMVALIACLKNKKMAVLLSHLEKDQMIEKLQEVVSFKKIITDSDVDLLLRTKSITDIHFTSLDLDSPAIIVFSSGTTAMPKGIALSFNNLFFSALGFSEYFHQLESETSLINLPHNHVGGLMTLWRAFLSGGRLTSLMDGPFDFISLVPLQLKRMLDDPKSLSMLQKIRVILIGGAPLSDDLKVLSSNNKITLYETYGMSESTSLVMINGEVLPYREVKLDVDGFFTIKGKTLAQGYFQNKKFTPMSHEWFKTNDRGILNNFGKFVFKERADLIFISGGENINPLLVEEIVKRHPLIKDAYLLPISDEKWGSLGVLLFDTNENMNVSCDDLKAFLKDLLHPYQVPKFFFQTKLNLEGQLKLKRSELKILVQELYLKNIFSFDYRELKNAPLLVVLHGFMGEKNDLSEALSSLEKTHSLLFIDLPGHGKTSMSHFHSFNDVFIKLSNFIKLFGEHPSIYGYSMGGRIALHLAIHYITPAHLILESAGLGLKNEQEKIERRENDSKLFNGVDRSTTLDFLKRWYQNPMFKIYSESPTFKKDIEKKSLHDFKEWRESQKFFSVGEFPLRSETLLKIKESSWHCTYIYGEEDIKYRDYAQMLTDLRSGIDSYMIEKAGHNPHKTHPAEISFLLKRLMQ